MAKEKVGEDGQERCRDGAREDDRVADHCDPAEDERTETAGANGSGNRGYPDGDDSGSAYAREDDTESERETDAQENLCVGHAHSFGGFEDRGVDDAKADICVAENRKKRIENEGDDGGAAADASDKGDWY